jgi:hypothetical protein
MMKLKVGDVFTIPISEEETGFGQIIKIPNKSNFIIVVFKQVYSGKDWPSIEEIIGDDILFLGYTMDALLYHKYWRIIGNDTSNLNKIKLPYFKLGTPPNMKIVNYKGDSFRKAKKDEFDKLEYETVVAPVGYEAALQAYHKLTEWEDDFNKLLYDKTLESIKIAEGK